MLFGVLEFGLSSLALPISWNFGFVLIFERKENYGVAVVYQEPAVKCRQS